MSTSGRNAFLLGSLAVATFAAIGSGSGQDPGAQTPGPLGTLSQTVPAAHARRGAGAHLPALNSTSDQVHRILVSRESPPGLIREGQLVKIPRGSLLRRELTIAAAAAKEIQRTLTVTAVVEALPSQTVHVLAPIVGRVVDVKAQLGDRVATDQELALVYAGVAHVHSGDRRVELTPQLPDNPAASDPQTGFQSTLSDAAHDCQHVEAERSTPGLCARVVPTEGIQQTRLFSLRAPVAGSVIDVGVRPGVRLDDPSSSIMTIADLETIWVTTSLRKKDAAFIVPGRRVEIAFTAYPNEVFMGEARFIGDTPQPYASGFTASIELPNPSRRVKPNMSALATFLGPKDTLPIIPTTVLIRKNERDWVFVAVEQWTFEARPVEVGFQQDDKTVVVSGFDIGERVVVMGAALLDD